MARLSGVSIPTYRHHKPSGQAVVSIDGRDLYLGTYRSAASRAEYNRVIAEWLAAGRRLPTDPATITIAEVVSQFRQHAKRYYRDADANVSRSVDNFDEALRPVLKLYGKTPAAEFGPLRLKACRDQMIRDERARTNINRHVTRIRGVLKWAVENELLPASVHHGLMAVGGLRRGRCEVAESDPVQPVPMDHVEAVLPFVSRQVAAMIRLQALTGARPGEVTIMRTGDIDRGGKLWVYKPARHKSQIHGHAREIYLGPKAQETVSPFLKLDRNAYIFSPADAEQEGREALHANRKTPLSCGNVPGSQRNRTGRKVNGVYSVSAYYLAIQRGCDRADGWHKGGMVIDNEEGVIPRWNPHRIRHTAATEPRKTHGLEAAQCVLGHRTLTATQIYAAKNTEHAMKIMAEIG
jgi:integrase